MRHNIFDCLYKYKDEKEISLSKNVLLGIVYFIYSVFLEVSFHKKNVSFLNSQYQQLKSDEIAELVLFTELQKIMIGKI